MGKNKKSWKKVKKEEAKMKAPGFGSNYKFKRTPGKPNARGKKWFFQMALQPPDWSKMNLEAIRKDFYQEHRDVKARDEAAVREYREEKRITVKGFSCPKPIQTFDECNFSGSIASALRALKFVTPTPIQSQALPVALSGRDMVGIAQTGSGKTLAYILPAITHIYGKTRSGRPAEPDVVVLAPTRELAQQIHQVVLSLGPGIGVNCECFYGGTKRTEQQQLTCNPFEICIATPGRLCDFLYEKIISLHRCSYVVLDEADRMLDLGFEPQIKLVINQARPDRQMLMFSATWPPEVLNLSEQYLKDCIKVNIGSLQISANHNITQKIEICQDSEKPERIVKIMKNVMAHKENKTLVFVNSKIDVDLLTLKFRLNGWNALGLHGSKKQPERDQVFGDFKVGKILILIATDVAARGLDVDDIKFIINYDYPSCSEDYVHRIGRTARCDRTGTAITFFTNCDRSKASDLISVLEEAGQHVPDGLQHLATLPDSKKGKKFLKPKEQKMKKRQIKKIIARTEINRMPLGALNNSETLPDLDQLLESLQDEIAAVPEGKKRGRGRKQKLNLSLVMNSVAQVPPYKRVKGSSNSLEPMPVYGKELNMPDEIPGVKFGVQPDIQGGRSFEQGNLQSTRYLDEEPPSESFMHGNGQNIYNFSAKHPTNSIVETKLNHPAFSVHDQMSRENPDSGMNNRDPVYSDSYQQEQRMGPNFRMSFDDASMLPNRRDEGFPMDDRNMGMAMNPGSTRMAMNPGSTRMAMSPGSTRMAMNPGSTRMAMNPGSTSMAMNPGSTRMLVNYNHTKMPMNPENIERPAVDRNMGIPVDSLNTGIHESWRPRNAEIPVDSRNAGMPVNPRSARMPMEYGNSGSTWAPRSMEIDMNPRDTGLPPNHSRNDTGWSDMSNSSYNYMGHQNSNWGNHRNNNNFNWTNTDHYPAQNTWSASGSNSYPGRYSSY